MTTPKLSAAEDKVLLSLGDYIGEDACGSFDQIADGVACFFPNALMNRKGVRRACRSLSRKGLAYFARGLLNDDGEVAGSGYGITPAGRAALADRAAIQED